MGKSFGGLSDNHDLVLVPLARVGSGVASQMVPSAAVGARSASAAQRGQDPPPKSAGALRASAAQPGQEPREEPRERRGEGKRSLPPPPPAAQLRLRPPPPTAPQPPAGAGVAGAAERPPAPVAPAEDPAPRPPPSPPAPQSPPAGGVAPAAAASSAAAQATWQGYRASDCRPYYYRADSLESVWGLPAGVSQVTEVDSEPAPRAPPSPPAPQPPPAGGVAPAAAASSAASQAMWWGYRAAGGRPYYWRENSQDIVWELPAGVSQGIELHSSGLWRTTSAPLPTLEQADTRDATASAAPDPGQQHPLEQSEEPRGAWMPLTPPPQAAGVRPASETAGSAPQPAEGRRSKKLLASPFEVPEIEWFWHFESQQWCMGPPKPGWPDGWYFSWTSQKYMQWHDSPGPALGLPPSTPLSDAFLAAAGGLEENLQTVIRATAAEDTASAAQPESASSSHRGAAAGGRGAAEPDFPSLRGNALF